MFIIHGKEHFDLASCSYIIAAWMWGDEVMVQHLWSCVCSQGSAQPAAPTQPLALEVLHQCSSQLRARGETGREWGWQGREDWDGKDGHSKS